MVRKSWDRSLETGYKLIDDQHHELLDLIDFLDKAKQNHKEVLKLLDKIMEFTVVHFISEEKLMKKVKYPSKAAKEMIKQHHEFKSYIRLRILEFRQEKKIDLESFKSFVKNYLVLHEFGIDKKLADWIRKYKEIPSKASINRRGKAA